MHHSRILAASIGVAANYGIEQKKHGRGKEILHVDNPWYTRAQRGRLSKFPRSLRKWMLSKALPKIDGDKIAAEINAKVAVEDAPRDRLELARWMALTLAGAVAEECENTRLCHHSARGTAAATNRRPAAPFLSEAALLTKETLSETSVKMRVKYGVSRPSRLDVCG